MNSNNNKRKIKQWLSETALISMTVLFMVSMIAGCSGPAPTEPEKDSQDNKSQITPTPSAEQPTPSVGVLNSENIRLPLPEDKLDMVATLVTEIGAADVEFYYPSSLKLLSCGDSAVQLDYSAVKESDVNFTFLINTASPIPSTINTQALLEDALLKKSESLVPLIAPGGSIASNEIIPDAYTAATIFTVAGESFFRSGKYTGTYYGYLETRAIEGPGGIYLLIGIVISSKDTVGNDSAVMSNILNNVKMGSQKNQPEESAKPKKTAKPKRRNSDPAEDPSIYDDDIDYEDWSDPGDMSDAPEDYEEYSDPGDNVY